MPISNGKQTAAATIDRPIIATATRNKVEDEVSLTEAAEHFSVSLRNLVNSTNVSDVAYRRRCIKRSMAYLVTSHSL